jgi:hypothetical protein
LKKQIHANEKSEKYSAQKINQNSAAKPEISVVKNGD